MVNRKFVLMIRDGITPRRVEENVTRAKMETLAHLVGWDVSDIAHFARAMGITKSAARPRRAAA